MFDYRRGSKYLNWDRPGLDWELSLDVELLERDDQEELLTDLLTKKYSPSDYLLLLLDEFKLYMRNKGDLYGLMMVHDWVSGQVAETLNNFLESKDVGKDAIADLSRCIEIAIERIKQH